MPDVQRNSASWRALQFYLSITVLPGIQPCVHKVFHTTETMDVSQVSLGILPGRCLQGRLGILYWIGITKQASRFMAKSGSGKVHRNLKV